MEENLLKYFTNNLNYTTQTIQPSNVANGLVSDLNEMQSYRTLLVSNDGNYLIRYGGSPITGRYNAIEVFNNDSIKNNQVLYSFSNLTINGHLFTLRSLKQDEDGRFYGIGCYFGSGSLSEYYLILFNNFIQDGFCEIRKFYSTTVMGIDTEIPLINVVKKQGSADYYILANTLTQIFHYKIDVMQGNELKTYNFSYTGSFAIESYTYDIEIVENSLILMIIGANSNNDVICQKLVINTDEEPKEMYYITDLYQFNNNGILMAYRIKNFKYFIAYLNQIIGGYHFYFRTIDLNRTIKTYTDSNLYTSNGNEEVSFSDNYITFINGTNLNLFYYDQTNLKRFYNGVFSGSFGQLQELKQFNLVNLVGINSTTSLAYSINEYSIGYSSTPYINRNFMIPQYLELYAKSNDNSSLVYSRDAINRYLSDNQLTTTFNIPNYLLNNTSINREIVKGQTNQNISNLTNNYTKNRFESLFMTYMYDIQIVDNSNGNNTFNKTGSNRLANSVWNLLDDNNSACLKARLTYENDSQSILNLNTTNMSGNICTINFTVNGNVRKIEYMSNDLQTVYATYRCNLTGTNTITQTITIE